MKCSRFLVPILLTTLYLSTATRANAADNLDAVWALDSAEMSGMTIKGDQAKGRLPSKLIIVARQAALKSEERTINVELNIDEKASPKVLDMRIVGAPKEGVLKGIYKLEGDTLTICLREARGGVGDRPTEFSTKAPGDIIFVWKRTGEQPKITPPTKEELAALRDTAGRMKSMNNLKQFALAIHYYHDVMGTMPSAIVDKQGKPLLSWRVAILPYIEQEPLYRQFKLDEPWDSEHNKKLIEKMPSIYLSPRLEKGTPGLTVYQRFVGPQAFDPVKGMKLLSITDGTSNTIMLVEASTEVPWTKPADIEYAPAKALPNLGEKFDGKVLVAMCDGSVRVLDLKKMKESTLRALITPNGGESIPNE